MEGGSPSRLPLPLHPRHPPLLPWWPDQLTDTSPLLGRRILEQEEVYRPQLKQEEGLRGLRQPPLTPSWWIRLQLLQQVSERCWLTIHFMNICLLGPS